MEEFLKDYVRMFVECNDNELSNTDIEKIVKRIQNEDEIWDTLDYYIDSYIGDLKK